MKFRTKIYILSFALIFTWFYLPALINVAQAADVAVDTTILTTNTSGHSGSPTVVWTSDTTGYVFYLDSAGGISMSSTTDSGATWSASRNVDSANTTDAVSVAVWYDRWTRGDTTGNLIHIATTDTSVDDVYYTQLDLSTGAFSTSIVGTTQGATCTRGSSCYTSITKAENGVLYMTASDGGDSWVVSCSASCTGANWSEITGAFGSTPDTGDDVPILVPLVGTNNVMLIYADTSASTIDYNVYSATSSAWWFTATKNAVTAAESNTSYEAQLLGVTTDIYTGITYLTYIDDANDYTTQDHDVNVWSYSSTTIAFAQATEPVTDASGGLTGAKIAIDTNTNDLYVIYGRRSTIGTAATANLYYKYSSDGGANWSAESSAINSTADDINAIGINIMSADRIGATWNYTTAPNADQQFYNTVVNIPFVISGNLYTDEGTTAFNCSSSGKTVKASINGAAPISGTCTASTGAYSITYRPGMGAGTPVSVWVDGASTFRSFALTKASTTDSITNLKLYQNRVITRYEASSGTTTAISDLSIYDGDNDTDIMFKANGGTLEVNAGNMLYVWPGTEFAPSGAVTLHGDSTNSADVNGSLRLPFGTNQTASTQAGATLTMGANNLTLGGNWYASSSASFSNTGTVTFNATTSTKNIIATSTNFYNVTFNGSSGGWTFGANSATTTNNFTITTGTLTAPSTGMAVQGNFTQNGTFANNSGTTTFYGPSQTVSGTLNAGSALGNILINGNSNLSSANWYNTDWLYRKKISIDKTKVVADLTDFPVLISLTDSNLASGAQSDGDDILFAAGDGTTRLPHELEQFTSTTGTLNAWVKANVSSTTNTDIYMYYGNSATSSEETPTSVWDSNYVGVWHMAEDPSISTDGDCGGGTKEVCDSTSNNSDADSAGSMTSSDLVNSPFGKTLDFDGVDDYLGVTRNSILNSTFDGNHTVCLWTKNNSAGTVQRLWEIRDTSSGEHAAIFNYTSAGKVHYYESSELDAEALGSTASNLNNGQWRYLCFSLNGSTQTTYVDGVQDATRTQVTGVNTDSQLAFGTDPTSPQQYFPGQIDDIRVSNIARSAGWITTEYNNQSATSTFYTVGSQQGQDFWYNIDWSYRKKITIDSDKVVANLPDFPVLVSLTDSDLASRAQGDGDDILFTTADGVTRAPHEIEQYTSTTGTLNAWVKTDVSSTTNTVLYMYYDNAATSSEETPTSVWDSNYVGVWHMAEDPSISTDGDCGGGTKEGCDSTSNNNDTDSNGTMTSSDIVNSRLGKAINFDGTDDYMSLTLANAGTSLNQGTFSGWVKLDSKDAYDAIMETRASTFAGLIMSGATNNPLTFAWDGVMAEYDAATGLNMSLAAWYFVAGAIRSNGVDLYLGDASGALSTYTDSNSNGLKNIEGVWNFGKDPNFSTRYLDGLIDELRISNVTRSSGWVTTEYNNMSATSTFYSLAAEASQGASVTFSNNASTTNLMINSGILTAPSAGLLSVSGNYSNSGKFTANSSTLTLNGSAYQALSGTMTGTSAFYNLEVTNNSASTTFGSAVAATNNFTAQIPGVRLGFKAGAAATSTLQNIILSGSAATPVYVHSATGGSMWGLAVPGTRSVAYANIMDSNACSGYDNIDASGGTVTDSGNNTCWTFAATQSATLALGTPGVQETNQFTSASVSNANLLNFQLTPSVGSVTITGLSPSISLFGISASDITNAQIFVDYDGDGLQDSGDLAILGSGSVSSSVITYSGSYSTSTSRNYFLQADVANLAAGDEMWLTLDQLDITTTASKSGSSQFGYHVLNSSGVASGGGGGGGAVGAGIVSNANADQGGGDSIGAEDGFTAPTANGTGLTTPGNANNWTNGGNAYASDNSYATAGTAVAQDYGNFGFSIPSSDTITGIDVKVESKGSTAAGTFSVALSWNGGTTYTTATSSWTLSTSDQVFVMATSSDLWGRASWSPSEFSDANFRLRITAAPSSNTVSVDAIQVKVDHQATGGGGGGGGRSALPYSKGLAMIYQSFSQILEKLAEILAGVH